MDGKGSLFGGSFLFYHIFLRESDCVNVARELCCYVAKPEGKSSEILDK